MVIGIVLTIVGGVVQHLDRYVLGLILLMAGGTLIGLGAVAAYFANVRLQAADRRKTD